MTINQTNSPRFKESHNNIQALESACASLGFSREVVRRHPEEIQFLIQTRLFYTIIGLQKTTVDGPTLNEIRVSRSGLSIKKQGAWVPVATIRSALKWNSDLKALESKNNPNERWNYLKYGLAPIDRYYHHEACQQPNYPKQNVRIQPITQLAPEEMKTLLRHANAFDGIDRGKKRDCVVQFVTNPRSLSVAPWRQNSCAQAPVHCGIRLIRSDGTIYSTGLGRARNELVFSKGCQNYFTTVNAQPAVGDYEEFCPHEGRIVTSIAIDKNQAEAMLDKLNRYRSSGVRFNIFKQNCMTLGSELLAMAGVSLNIRVPIHVALYRALPDLRTLPVVGPLFAAIKEKIVAWLNKAPRIVTKTMNLIGALPLYIPKKIVLAILNAIVWICGGRNASPKIASKTEQKRSGDSMSDFDTLSNSLISDKSILIDHSAVFIQWQLQQKSTAVHAYTGQPNMNVLPPDKPETVEYSQKKIAELEKIYRYSTPVNS